MSLASARAFARREPLPTTMATSSLSPRPAAPRRNSFSRGRSFTEALSWLAAAVYSGVDVAPRYLVRCCVALPCVCALLVFARHRPAPRRQRREMDQAQGAIDAARAAGADRYATEQYEAAVKALQSAHRGRRAARLPAGAELCARQPRPRTTTRPRKRPRQQAVLRSGVGAPARRGHGARSIRPSSDSQRPKPRECRADR